MGRALWRVSAYLQELTAENIAQSEMHLTNVAVQKKSETYNVESGGKWFIDDLKNYIAAKHGTEVANRAFYDCQQVRMCEPWMQTKWPRRPLCIGLNKPARAFGLSPPFIPRAKT